MKANEGTIDRIVRAVLGVILLGLGIFAVTGWVGWVLGILGVIMLVTAAVGFCPLYTLFGINTKAKA